MQQSLLNVGSHEKNYEDKKKNLRKLFSNYIIIESQDDSEDILIEALNKFCQIHSYDIYDLRNKESNIQYLELVGVSFYTKNNSHPEIVIENLYWDKNQSIYFSQTKEENEFSLLWRSLSQSDEAGYYGIEYISKSSSRTGLLDEFEILFIHRDDEPWREKEIFSPYQNVNGMIELLDLDSLGIYVANRKGDLTSLEKYKDAYRKLVLEIDKYK